MLPNRCCTHFTAASPALPTTRPIAGRANTVPSASPIAGRLFSSQSPILVMVPAFGTSSSALASSSCRISMRVLARSAVASSTWSPASASNSFANPCSICCLSSGVGGPRISVTVCVMFLPAATFLAPAPTKAMMTSPAALLASRLPTALDACSHHGCVFVSSMFPPAVFAVGVHSSPSGLRKNSTGVAQPHEAGAARLMALRASVQAASTGNPLPSAP